MRPLTVYFKLMHTPKSLGSEGEWMVENLRQQSPLNWQLLRKLLRGETRDEFPMVLGRNPTVEHGENGPKLIPNVDPAPLILKPRPIVCGRLEILKAVMKAMHVVRGERGEWRVEEEENRGIETHTATYMERQAGKRDYGLLLRIEQFIDKEQPFRCTTGIGQVIVGEGIDEPDRVLGLEIQYAPTDRITGETVFDPTLGRWFTLKDGLTPTQGLALKEKK